MFLLDFFKFGWTHPVVPRAYSWLCIQGSFLVGLGDLRIRGPNLGWPCARQTCYLLCNHFVPIFLKMFFGGHAQWFSGILPAQCLGSLPEVRGGPCTRD